MTSIPIVDLGKIDHVENAAQNPEWISAAEKIREGLGAVGFLYLTNHGVSEITISQAFEQSEKFFRLPEEVKLKYKKDTSGKNQIFDYDKNWGYTSLGSERLNPEVKYEHKEIFDWSNSVHCSLPSSRVIAQFKEKLVQLDTECKALLKKFYKLLAMALKLDDIDFFVRCNRHLDDPLNNPGFHIGRLNHYPRIPDNDEKFQLGGTRCSAHTDYVFMTLLIQDSVGGLEVQTVDGEWIKAEFIPGSIIVNTGDLTEFWTSGIFPATPHRVSISDATDEKRRKSRYSIAIFHGPELNTLITPLSLEKRPAEVRRLQKTKKTYSKKPISAYDHVMGRVANQYA